MKSKGILIIAVAILLGLGGCGTTPHRRDVVQTGTPLLPDDIRLSDTASVFPLQHYDQQVDHWIDPQQPDYRQSLLSRQQQQHALDDYRRRYFGDARSPNATTKNETSRRAAPQGPDTTSASQHATSPWEQQFVESQNSGFARITLTARISNALRRYGPDGPNTGYGMNLRPYPPSWMAAIAANVDIGAFAQAPAYSPDQRAITTGNVLVRLLPTRDPFFYDPRLPGEGYPFDNLQDTALRPGTPVYIVGATRNGDWLYLLTPDMSGWAENDRIGRVDDHFIAEWRTAAWQQLGAVVRRDVSLNSSDGTTRFNAPIGTTLPMTAPDTVMVPVLDSHRQAHIGMASAAPGDIVLMPWPASPEHFAALLKALQGRPYGWGGTNGYNDCSLELKSLFTPFAIWLARHSTQQVEGPGMVDLSSATTAARIQYLSTHGIPFLTIINIPGHVMLYLGNRVINGQPTPLLYEEMWGLSPADHSRRAIIGQSVILPLLTHFPEDPTLASQAAQAAFRIGFAAQADNAPAPSSDDAASAESH